MKKTLSTFMLLMMSLPSFSSGDGVSNSETLALMEANKTYHVSCTDGYITVLDNNLNGKGFDIFGGTGRIDELVATKIEGDKVIFTNEHQSSDFFANKMKQGCNLLEPVLTLRKVKGVGTRDDLFDITLEANCNQTGESFYINNYRVFEKIDAFEGLAIVSLEVTNRFSSRQISDVWGQGKMEDFILKHDLKDGDILEKSLYCNVYKKLD